MSLPVHQEQLSWCAGLQSAWRSECAQLFKHNAHAFCNIPRLNACIFIVIDEALAANWGKLRKEHMYNLQILFSSPCHRGHSQGLMRLCSCRVYMPDLLFVRAFMLTLRTDRKTQGPCKEKNFKMLPWSKEKSLCDLHVYTQFKRVSLLQETGWQCRDTEVHQNCKWSRTLVQCMEYHSIVYDWRGEVTGII